MYCSFLRILFVTIPMFLFSGFGTWAANAPLGDRFDSVRAIYAACENRMVCHGATPVYTKTARRYICEIAIDVHTSKPLLACFWSVAGFRTIIPVVKPAALN